MDNLYLFMATTLAYLTVWYFVEWCVERPNNCSEFYKSNHSNFYFKYKFYKRVGIVFLLCAPFNINGSVITVLGNAKSEKSIFSVCSLYQKTGPDGSALNLVGLFNYQSAGEGADTLFGISSYQSAKDIKLGGGISIYQSAERNAATAVGLSAYQSAKGNALVVIGISGYQRAEQGEAVLVAGLSGYQSAGNHASTGIGIAGCQSAKQIALTTIGLTGCQFAGQDAITAIGLTLYQKAGEKTRTFGAFSKLSSE